MVTPPTCPVCHSTQSYRFFQRTDVPIHENMVYADRDKARVMPRGDMELHCCTICGFAFNSLFQPKLMQYSGQYDNTQTHSHTFNQHVETTVRSLIVDRGVRDCLVVEVGCGKGDFVRRLVEFEGASNRGYGIDPTYEGPLSDLDGRLRFEQKYYGPDCVQIRADVVVSRHMIEHVPDPVGLFRTVRAAMKDSPKPRFFLETRNVEWALDRDSVWDLIYEACSYFNATSLTNALLVAGFEITAVDSVFDDQYLIIESVPVERPRPMEHLQPGRMPVLCEAFGRRISAMIEAWQQHVSLLADDGPLAIWGAGSKGMTFANVVDPGGDRIVCCVDVNPRKHGTYLPGTGHPILSPEKATQRCLRSVLVMNRIYRDEIAAQMRELNCDAEVMGWEELAKRRANRWETTGTGPVNPRAA